MSNWTPNPEWLQQLTHMLAQCLVPNQEVQREVYKKLQEFHRIPDFNNYLVCIFTKLSNTTPQNREIRVSAGLNLKNNLTLYYHRLNPEVQEYIKKEVLVCIADEADSIRTTAGSIISAIVKQSKLENWPNLIEDLVSGLSSTSAIVIDGILSTLAIICEDYAYTMCSPAENTLGGPERYANVLNVLIPKLLQFLTVDVSQFRRHALRCLNQFIPCMPAALRNNFDTYIRGVFVLINDPSAQIRKVVCESFVQMVHLKVEFLVPKFDQVVDFMLKFTKDDDEGVALEACEFWLAVCDARLKDNLRPHLPRLVPILLDCMVYSEVDLFLLQKDNEDCTVPDDPKDIEPIHFKGNSRGDFADDDSEEESEGEHGPDDGYSEWNLRRASACALDSLSTLFGDELLNTLIPALQPKMNSDCHWPIIESSILSLGAIAVGCYTGMQQYLPKVIPYLIDQLRSPEVLVKSITCWSLSRYSPWIIQQQNPKEYLEPVLQNILAHMLDTNKKMQQAACSAFTHLQEQTRVCLVNYIEPILSTIAQAFKLYQKRNMLILFDGIGIFAESSILGQNRAIVDRFSSVVLPPLIEKWTNYSDDDRALYTLAECLMGITTAVRMSLQPYAEAIYRRCLNIIETNLVAFATPDDNPDPDFILVCLNLITHLTGALQESMESLVAKSNILGLIFRCMKETQRIRSEAFALVGDLCPYAMAHLAPVLEQFIPVLIENMQVKHLHHTTASNACWALGMIIRYANDQLILPFAPMILQALANIFNGDVLTRGLLENTAITLGWLANRVPALVAGSLGDYVRFWTMSLRDIIDSEDKQWAFAGLCKVVEMNPQAVFNQNLVQLAEAIAAWREPSEELSQRFYHILQMFKQNSPTETWDKFMNCFAPATRDKLSSRYNI